MRDQSFHFSKLVKVLDLAVTTTREFISQSQSESQSCFRFSLFVCHFFFRSLCCSWPNGLDNVLSERYKLMLNQQKLSKSANYPQVAGV